MQVHQFFVAYLDSIDDWLSDLLATLLLHRAILMAVLDELVSQPL